MNTLLALSILLLAGCDPVANCKQAPRSDCCIYDSECLTYYGNDFPYCNQPGRATGTCSECVTSADCLDLDRPNCSITEDDFGICVP